MSNFEFLKNDAPLFYQLLSVAEHNFSADPNTTLMKIRQFGEALAQDVAARSGIDFYPEISQADLLYRISREIKLERTVLSLFHTIRIEGNKATHQFQTKHKEAMDSLKLARELSLWYYRSFFDYAFSSKPFSPPTDPSIQLRELQSEIQTLRVQSEVKNTELIQSQEMIELLAREKEAYSVLALQMDSEAKTYEQMARDFELELQNQKKSFESELLAIRKEAQANTNNIQVVTQKTQNSSRNIVLNEQLTRILIDQQLIECGWDADTELLTYAKGARPEKGKNKAIAEWPTIGKQSADYVLFVGLTPIAVLEAKKENENVAGMITQAERYARGFSFLENFIPAWTFSGEFGPWSDGNGEMFNIPFAFSANGRPYVKQLEEKSGVWFRDLRKPSNIKGALQGFFSPQGLLDKLAEDRATAESQLKAEPFGYLRLREYQEKAIKAVENALEQDQKKCLLAMATGTGKTRTIIGLMYRFLKTNRFKRILFLVDRTALGRQANDSFNDALLEQSQPLSKIYNIAELGDMRAEAETKIQVATVQAMVKRIFMSDTPPTIDTYDCIIVDEAHRGYILDQEMTEGELEYRDADQYLSTYRRVLDYFDATLVGLTATPALHTTDIFGKPVYTYSYREAVADDWLIDHEPPIRYETVLSKKGIHFDKGKVQVINTITGAVESALLEDEIDFDTAAFNRRVITEAFNEVICKELVKELDPMSLEKTLIFCATDIHADMVKRLLDKEFKEVYGDDYNQAAVVKITGKSDKVETLIKQYKNEKYPTIAITVDLLTTGIDVPAICHLVFLRRVRSRILYEQMLGRATRRCDEIGKTVFKIYDPVGIYAALQDVNTMKPLIKDPKVTLGQLVEELTSIEYAETTQTDIKDVHAEDVLNAVSQKVMRILRSAVSKADKKPQLKEKLKELHNTWGVEPSELHKHLKKLGPQKAAEFIRANRNIVSQLEDVSIMVGSDRYPVISDHADKLETRDQNYGKYGRPDDYLDSFKEFIQNSINDSVALSVIVNRPKDLTREQLKEVKLFLDTNGFSEASLKTAWKQKSNQDIASSIIGYIRQAAIGDALIPYEERVKRGVKKILASRNWTDLQRKWIERLGKQLAINVQLIVDEEYVNSAFASEGGAKRGNSLLSNSLHEVLSSLSESIWMEAS